VVNMPLLGNLFGVATTMATTKDFRPWRFKVDGRNYEPLSLGAGMFEPATMATLLDDA